MPPAGNANIGITLFSQTESFTLQGNDGDNRLEGSNTSADSITGGLGNDTLQGNGWQRQLWTVATATTAWTVATVTTA